ncbi:MAG: hypothetical protein ACPGXL_09110 [Chitinophagales bacterium]
MVEKISSGNFRLLVKMGVVHQMEQILSGLPHDDYAIFTGTVGENRKSIIAIR